MSESLIVQSFQQGEREELSSWLQQRLSSQKAAVAPKPPKAPEKKDSGSPYSDVPAAERQADPGISRPGTELTFTHGSPFSTEGWAGAVGPGGYDPLRLDRIRNWGGDVAAWLARKSPQAVQSAGQAATGAIVEIAETLAGPVKREAGMHDSLTEADQEFIFGKVIQPRLEVTPYRFETWMRVLGEIAASPESYVMGAPGVSRVIGAVDRKLAEQLAGNVGKVAARTSRAMPPAGAQKVNTGEVAPEAVAAATKQAEYRGFQEGFGDTPGFHMWNTVEDAVDPRTGKIRPAGSTLGTEELDALGVPHVAPQTETPLAKGFRPSQRAESISPGAQAAYDTIQRSEEMLLRDTGEKVAAATKTGGSTYNLKRHELVSPEKGFAVSIAPERELTLSDELTPEHVMEFVRQNKDVLEDVRAHIGTWTSEGKTHVDISTVVDDLAEALDLGRRYNQKAVFDFAKKADIQIPTVQPGAHPYPKAAAAMTEQDVKAALEYDLAVTHPAAKETWERLGAEVDRVYDDVAKRFQIEQVSGQPYASLDAMVADIKAGRLKVSADNSEHPFWTVDRNVRFRAIHDITGHDVGNGFDLKGEFNAFLRQAEQMGLTDDLKAALQTEVYGQAAAFYAHDAFQAQKAFLPASRIDLPAITERLGAIKVNGKAVEGLSNGLDATRARIVQAAKEIKDSILNQEGRVSLRGDITATLGKNRQLMNDLAEIGATYLWMGARSFKDWSIEMVRTFGEIVEPALKDLYEAAQKALVTRKTAHPNLVSFKKISEMEERGAYARDWYDGALDEAEGWFGPNADLYLRLYAATSPQSSAATSNFVLANKAMELMLTGEVGSAGRSFRASDGFIGAHLHNLNRVVKGEDLSGPKVGEFYPALAGDRNAVTVDTWMGRGFGLANAEGRFDPSQRNVLFVTTAVKRIAEEIGTTPRGSQAAIWATTKIVAEGEQTIAPFREMLRAQIQKFPKELLTESMPRAVSKETLESVPAWVTEEGRVNLASMVVLGRAALGAVAGALTGDDPEDAARNALLGAGIGSLLSPKLARLVVKTLDDPAVFGALKRSFEVARGDEGAIRLRFPSRAAGDRPSPNTERMGVSPDAKRLIRGINEKLQDAKKLSRSGVVTNDETIQAALQSEYRSIEEVLKLDVAKIRPEDLAAARTAARGARDFVLEDTLQTFSQVKVTGSDALAAEARQKFALAGKVSQRVTDLETHIARAQQAGNIKSTPALGSQFDLDVFARDIAEMDAVLAKGITNAELVAMVTEKADRSRLAKLAGTASKYPEALWNIYYGLNLLSSPVTHAKNILGDMAGLTLALVDRGFAEGIELVMKPFTAVGMRQQNIAFGETYDMARGVWEVVGDALRAGKQTFKTGESAFGATKAAEMDAIASQRLNPALESSGLPKIIDVMSTLARKNLNFMDGTDEFFKVLSFNGELRALARRQAMAEGRTGKEFVERVHELIDDPTSNMLQNAQAFAHENTFTKAFNPSEGGWRRLWGLGAQAESFAKTPIMRYAVTPFFRTPTRLAEFSTTHTPILNALAVQTWSDIAAGGAKAELAFAKMATGSSIAGLVFWQATHGYVTGDWPSDPGLREAYRRADWQPYSIYNPINSKYYSYRGIEPIASIIGTVATFAQMAPHLPDTDVQTVVTAMALAFGHSAFDNPYFQGISDIGDIIEGASRGESVEAGLKWMGRRLAAAMPGAALGRGIARASDDVARETKTVADTNPETTDREVSTLVNEFKKQVPGWSKSRPAVINIVTGEPMPMEGGWLGAVLPYQVTTNRNDPVLGMIADLDGAGLPRELPRVIGGTRPASGIRIEEASPREGVRLSDHERHRLGVLLTKTMKDGQGRTVYEAMHDLVVGPGFEHDLFMDASDGRWGGKSLALASTWNAYMDEAEAKLLDEFPKLNAVVQRRNLEFSLGRLPKSEEETKDPMRQMLDSLMQSTGAK